MRKYDQPVEAIVIAEGDLAHIHYPQLSLSPDGALTVLIRESHLAALHRQIAENPRRNLRRAKLADSATSADVMLVAVS